MLPLLSKDDFKARLLIFSTYKAIFGFSVGSTSTGNFNKSKSTSNFFLLVIYRE